MSIAIVVLTHNKPELLPQCVRNVLLRTSELTKEIIIWNNGSFDDTREYLDTLVDPRITVIHHARNIGQNAYALAFPMTTSDYLIEVDDDVVDAPPEWDRTLLEAFVRLPSIGYLAANLVEDMNDPTARAIYGKNAHLYRYETVNGVHLKLGPVGGGCTMTSREIHDRVGGFPRQERRVFFHEAGAFIRKIQKIGLQPAYLDELKVHHKGGFYGAEYYAPEKKAFWLAYKRRRRRKAAVKRILLRFPLVAPLNARFQWFQPPEPRKS